MEQEVVCKNDDDNNNKSDAMHDRFDSHPQGVDVCDKCDQLFRSKYVEPGTEFVVKKDIEEWIYEYNNIEPDGVVRVFIGHDKMRWGGIDQRLYLCICLKSGMRSKFMCEFLCGEHEDFYGPNPFSIDWSDLSFTWEDDDV